MTYKYTLRCDLDDELNVVRRPVLNINLSSDKERLDALGQLISNHKKRYETNKNGSISRLKNDDYTIN